MPLPVTISGISTSVACVGPYKSSGGNYYFFGVDGTTATTLQAFKATDPASSWSSIATNTGFSTAVQFIAGYQNGDTIHLAVIDGATTSVNVKYRTFDMSSDSFVTSETIQSGFNPQTSAGANVYSCSIVFRGSDSQPIVLYNGARAAVMGNSYSRIVYSRRTGVATWSAAAAVDAGGEVNFRQPKVLLGSSDRCHFLWQQSTATQLNHRTLTSANSLQTASSASAVASSGGGLSIGVSYVDGANTELVVGSSSPNTNFTARFSSADTPTLTADATDPFSFLQAVPGQLFVDGTTVWLLQQSSADGDLYVNSSTDQGDTWGTQAAAFASITVTGGDTGLSKDGAIYQRGSNFVIPYVVNDNGTLKYNEHTVRVSGIAIEPAQANLALSTTAPTVSLGANVDISPASGNLALSSAAPSVVVDHRVDPASGNLSLSTTAPTVAQTTNVEALPASANLSLSTTAPTVERTAHVSITPATADLTLTTTVPSVTQDIRFDPASANLALSSVAPTVAIDLTLAPASANLTLSTFAPTVTLDVRFEPAAANLTLSSVAPNVVVGFNLSPATADLALTTVAPTVVVTEHRDITPAQGNLVLSGFAPTVTVGFEFVPASGNLTLSTLAPSVVQDIRRDPAAGDLALSTFAPSVVQDIRRDPTSANLALTTVAPIVERTDNVAASPTTAQLALSTTAPTIVATTNVAAEPAAANLALSTTAPTVEVSGATVISPATANLVLSTTAPTVQVSANNRGRPTLHAIEGGLANGTIMQSGLHPIELGIAA